MFLTVNKLFEITDELFRYDNADQDSGYQSCGYQGSEISNCCLFGGVDIILEANYSFQLETR